jgi:hypothetical protein
MGFCLFYEGKTKIAQCFESWTDSSLQVTVMTMTHRPTYTVGGVGELYRTKVNEV